jgi:hypothetical protein
MKIFKESFDPYEDKIRISYFGGNPILVEVCGLLFNVNYKDSVILAESSYPIMEIMEYNANEFLSYDSIKSIKLYSEGFLGNVAKGIGAAAGVVGKGIAKAAGGMFRGAKNASQAFKSSYLQGKEKDKPFTTSKMVINAITNYINTAIKNAFTTGKFNQFKDIDFGSIVLPDGRNVEIKLSGIITENKPDQNEAVPTQATANQTGQENQGERYPAGETGAHYYIPRL